MKTFAVAALAMMLGFSLGAVDLVDGAELTIGQGETCTVSGTYTIPRFVNNGTLTLGADANVTVDAAEHTASSHMANGAAVNATLILESGARLTVSAYNSKDSNEALAVGMMGGTGTVTIAEGAYLSVPKRLRLSRNSANDRTPRTYAVMNVSGTVEVGTAELAGFWPNNVTDTNLYQRASELNILPNGVFRATELNVNDAAIARINMRGGTLRTPAPHGSYFYAGFGAIFEIDFAADTTSTFDTNGDLGVRQNSIVNISGSGKLVKTGTGQLSLYRPAGMGVNAFTGDIEVKSGSVYLGRALAEGQTVYVHKGASYVLAVPGDSAHITYEDPSDKPEESGLYTANADIDGGVDLTATTFDHDRLGGPTRGITATVRGVVTHAAATKADPFTLVGQHASGTLAFEDSGLESVPLLFSGAGTFRFPGACDLRAEDEDRLQFDGGAYEKTGTITFLSEQGETYRLSNGTMKAPNIYVGADGTNGAVVVSGGGLRATDTLYLGSNRSSNRLHTFSELTVTNGSVYSGNEMRFAAYFPQNDSSLCGRLTLQKDAALTASVILHDKAAGEIVFDGGSLQPRPNGKQTIFAVNEEGALTVRGTNGHDIVINSPGETNALADISASASPVRFTGDGGLRFRGKGQVTIGNVGALTMDYSGDTVIEEERVVLGADNPFPSGVGKGKLVVLKANALDLNGHVLRVNNYTAAVTNAIVNSSTTTAALDIGADNRDFPYNASLSEGIVLGKVGTGTMDMRTTMPRQLVVKEGTVRVGTPVYRHYRFKIEKACGATSDSACIGEFKLLNGEMDVTRPYKAVSQAPSGNSPDGEKPAKAVDGDMTTKFLDFNGANDKGSDEKRNNCWLHLEYETPIAVTHYTWSTGGDNYSGAGNRNPTDWRFQGSMDGQTWIDLDVRTGYVVANATKNSWIGEEFALGAPSHVDGTDVQVASGGKFEIDGEINLSSLDSEGRTILSDTTTLRFTRPGNCSGRIEGAGTIEKRGTGMLAMDVDESFTGSIVAREGSVCFSKGITSKWFRFTVRKTNSGAGEAMQLSEFKLLDVAGARQNLNMQPVADGTAPAQMAPGTFCAAATYKTGSSSETLSKIFDGQTGTKWCVVGVKDLIDGKESAWCTFTLRLSDAATPITAFNLTTANDGVQRTPSSWLLETSTDGIDWQTLDDRTGVHYPDTTFTDLNGGTPFALARTSGESTIVRATVEAAAGATVKVMDAPTQLSALRVDCTAGAGTFTGVNFASEGVLYLTNVGNLGSTTTLPMTVTDARNSDNLRNWKVYVDGVLKPGVKVSVSGTTLRVVAGGTVIYFR